MKRYVRWPFLSALLSALVVGAASVDLKTPAGPNSPAAGWTSDGTTTSTTQGATVTNAAGLSATLFGNINATTTLDLVSSTNDATTSATVGAVTIRPTVNLTDGDLVLNVEDSAGTNLFTVSEGASPRVAMPLAAYLGWGTVADGLRMYMNTGSGLIVQMAGGSTYLSLSETTGTLNLPLSGAVGPLLTFSASSGNRAWQILTNGALADFGAGASDHASSDGTTVTFAGPIASTAYTATSNDGIRFTNASGVGVWLGLGATSTSPYAACNTTLSPTGFSSTLGYDNATATHVFCQNGVPRGIGGGVGTAGSGTGITVNSRGAIATFVHKITVAETALAAAATSDITLWTVPAKTRMYRVVADVTAQHTGGGVTAVDVTCGTSAGGNQYLLSFDADAAAATFGDVAAEIGAGLLSATVADIPSFSGTTAVQCRYTCTGGNCDLLTAGSTTYYLEGVTYP